MRLLSILALAIILYACNEPAKPPAPNSVGTIEVLQVAPASLALVRGSSGTFAATYTDAAGQRQPVTPTWISLNTAVATVATNGTVTALTAGSSRIVAAYNGRTDTVVVNVVSGSNDLANLVLTPDSLELTRNQTANVQARGYTLDLQPYTLGNVSWTAANNQVASIANGTVSALAYGTTTVQAQSEGIVSPAIPVAVVRTGNFRGVEGHSGNGSVTVKEKNGQVFIRFESNFYTQDAPDLRVYLSNRGEGYSAVAQNGIEIALLRAQQGRQTYAVPAGITLGQYAHVVVYCRQYSTAVVTAALN